VGPLSFVMDMFGVLCTSYPKSSHSLDIYVCGILLNWSYLFNWDVTKIGTKKVCLSLNFNRKCTLIKFRKFHVIECVFAND